MLQKVRSLIGRTVGMSANKARDRITHGMLVVDVRDADEFAQGHIPGAIHIPLRQIEADAEGSIAPLASVSGRRDVILFVCRSGARSEAACKYLRSLLGGRAQFLTGGLMAWVGAGIPIAREPTSQAH